MQAPAGNRTTPHERGRNETIPEKTLVFPEIAGVMNTQESRGDTIRTCDLYVPNVAL